MKKILAIALLLCAVATATAAPKPIKCKYVNAAELTIINKADAGGAPFERLNVTEYNLGKSPKSAFSQSTGLAVVFRTNSKNIHARWASNMQS